MNSRISINVDAIPDELRDLDKWVIWQLVHRTGATKPTKVPFNARTGKAASTTDPTTWSSFEAVLSAYRSGQGDGIGYVFSADDPYTGIDLDGCYDPETGAMAGWAQELIDRFATYTEWSPSGKGVHLIIKGRLPGKGRRKGSIEMYSEARYFTFTGAGVEGTTPLIQERSNELAQIYQELFDDDNGQASPRSGGRAGRHRDDKALIKKAKSAKNGAAFTQLWNDDWSAYPSQSEADLALCSMLNYWTDGDTGRTDRLFRRSGLMRSKWDENRGEQTYGEMTIAKAQSGASSKDGSGAEQEPIRRTDTGNARRLIDNNLDDILWCEVLNNWYVYDGAKYAKDETREVERRAERTVREMYRLASQLSDESERADMARWAIQSENRNRIANMVESAKRMAPIHPTDFDKDPMLFNVANGAIDLRTQQIRGHSRADRITKRSNVVHDPDADCPLWISFLDRIFAGNQDIIAYVRRLFGYCITGLLTEHIIVFLYGTGANGKSTLLRTLRALAGDYAYHSRPEVFMAKRGDTQGFELVNLAGARLVTCAETGARRKLDEGLVKEMTGGEPITCAPKYGDFFTYQPVFKPILATNHKPQILGVDEGIWRRVQLVPFTVTIPKEEWDLTLYEKLVDELPGILNWTLQGVAEFLKKGLFPPEEVTAATSAYRDEQDALSGWLEENCVLHADVSDVYGELYDDYAAWCAANGDDAMSKSEFSSSLDQRGCEAKRGAKGKRMRLHIARRTVVGDG